MYAEVPGRAHAGKGCGMSDQHDQPRVRLQAEGRPDTKLSSRGVRKRSASLETNLTRKGIYSDGHQQLELPLDSEDLLGAVAITAPLRIFDLDTLAWLTELWRRTRPADGALAFTLYEMGRDFYGREPGGRERSHLRKSLWRLRRELVTLVGYDGIRRQSSHRLCSAENFLTGFQWDPGLDGRPCEWDPKQTGAMRATSFEVALAPWIIAQIEAGHVTYLDWPILRELRGTAKRLWVYLQSEKYQRAAGIGRAQAYIMLGERAYTALGLNHGRADHRRRAIAKAGREICAVDRSYESIIVEISPVNRKVWRILATRLSAEGQQVRNAGGLPFDPGRGDR